MTDVKRFIGVKEIKATPMTRQEYNDYRKWDLPEDENGSDTGYMVEYLDGGQANHPNHEGYISWSPEGVFKKAYRQVDGMTFGLAIEAMKKGHKISRLGWNGPGQFVVYQKGYPAGIPCNKQTADAFGMKEGDLFKVRPYLQIRCTDGCHQMWFPSVSDCLAEDWIVIE